MTKKTLLLASLPAPVLIALLLLFAGSTRVKADDRTFSGRCGGKNRQLQFWTTVCDRTRGSDRHVGQP